MTHSRRCVGVRGMGPKIILATVGSLGDLHPFIAVGQALKARSAQPVLAVPEDHVAKCRAAGLEAEAILPTFAEIGAATGLPDDKIVQRIIADMDFLVRRILLPPLPDSAERLARLSEDADVLVGSVFAMAAPIAAEARGIPFVPAVLQPMSWFSPMDPPKGPGFRGLARPPLGPVGAGWNRGVFAMMRMAMRQRYGAGIDAARARLGLPKGTAAPLLQSGVTPALSLGFYSSELAPLPADAAGPARLTGFPWFDSGDGSEPVLDAALAAFLADGPPPLVVSLGSFLPFTADAFYRDAAAVARTLGLRAVLLTGAAVGAEGQDVFACPYAPHSLLFPHAAAIVHHGGVGTTGQALRAGKPQLIVPFMGDQFDHADRLTRRGIALTTSAKRFRGEAPALLRRLLAEEGFHNAATIAGERVRAEDGAGTAAEALLALVHWTRSGSD